MIRRWQWAAGGLAVLAVAASVVFAATRHPQQAPPGPPRPASSVLIVDDCYDPGQVRPETIQLTCGDGSAVLSGLVWTEWDETTARGSGVLNQVICDPTCVGGNDADHQVDVVLSAPVTAGDGSRHFTAVAVTGRDVPPQTFQSCWAEPPAPYLPTCPSPG